MPRRLTTVIAGGFLAVGSVRGRRALPERLLTLVALTMLVAGCGGGGDARPAPPTGLTAQPLDGAVSLEWNASPASALAGYVVTVTVASGALVKNVDVPKSQTSAEVTGLTNGTLYTFTVSAEDSSGRRSKPSASVTATPSAAAAAPATPVGLAAYAQDKQVLLAWSPNTEEDLAGYTVHYGVAGGPLGATLEVAAGASSTMVSGLTNGTPYQFALEAVTGSGARSARTPPITATPQANLSAPAVHSVAITGYGASTQLRQGAGPIEVTLTGERLEGLTSARVLGAFDLTVQESTATSARLSGFVPHGLEVGPRTLVTASAAGEHAFPNALEVTKITAAKTAELNPSDVTGLGTPNRPFLTVSRALSVAGAGDTVLLGAGVYAEGESWPSGAGVPAPNVPAGVTIEGQSSDRGAVLLDGKGSATTDGLSFAGSAHVRNVSMRGFRYAMYAATGSLASRQGELLVENVAAFDNLTGLWVVAADGLTVRSSAFRNNSVGSAGGSGLLIHGVRQVRLEQLEIIGNRVGLRLTTTATGAPSTASLSDLTVTTNSQDGVWATNVSLFLRDSRIAENSGAGLNLDGAPPSLQVGSGTVLQGNTGFQLLDARQASMGTFRLSRYALPGSGITVGAILGPTQSGNYYRIINAGNGFLVE